MLLRAWATVARTVLIAALLIGCNAPIQTAQTTIDPDRPFERPSATPRPPTPPPQATTRRERPRGARPEERHLLRDDIARVQAALGTNPDGDLGIQTRMAIMEFQRGMNRRAGLTGKSIDVTGSLRDLPRGLSPLPPVFNSPFERAYFGTPTAYVKVDPALLSAFLAALGPPTFEQWPAGNSEADLAEKLNKMRARLGELTDAGKPVPLTSAAYDSLSSAVHDRLPIVRPEAPEK